MLRVMNKIRSFHIMTSATFWFAIAEIASAANLVTEPLPTLQTERVFVILVIVLLMFFLFGILFWWWQKVEQSSYFGILFRDTIKFNEASRLRAPIDAKWERGTYLNEIFLGETSRGEQWVTAHPRPTPGDELSNLANELGLDSLVAGTKLSMEIAEIAMRSVGGNRLPGSGDGFGTPDPTRYVTPPRDDEMKNKSDKFFHKRREFQEEVNKWVREAQAWAHQRYEEDLQEVKKQAAAQAERAMGAVDFSAIRGRGPEFVLEFTAVVVIIFAAVILGIAGQLTNEQIGTLLAAIAGYVLGKATTRGSSAQIQVVSDKTPEQGTGGSNQGNRLPSKGGDNQEDNSPPKKPG